MKHVLDAIRSATVIISEIETGFSLSMALTCNETSGLLGTKNQIKKATRNGGTDSKPKDHPTTRQRLAAFGFEFAVASKRAYLRG
jgi:hypothetical protein